MDGVVVGRVGEGWWWVRVYSAGGNGGLPSAKALLPRMNAGAPTELHTNYSQPNGRRENMPA